mmetsp:Transcript_29404/g.44453  ORF Transcript_29404/g.44453 Transcript_29404/m.44453 type:complete len:265 (-) Transcript_29404:918-1712(-)
MHLFDEPSVQVLERFHLVVLSVLVGGSDGEVVEVGLGSLVEERLRLLFRVLLGVHRLVSVIKVGGLPGQAEARQLLSWGETGSRSAVHINCLEGFGLGRFLINELRFGRLSLVGSSIHLVLFLRAWSDSALLFGWSDFLYVELRWELVTAHGFKARDQRVEHNIALAVGFEVFSVVGHLLLIHHALHLEILICLPLLVQLDPVLGLPFPLSLLLLHDLPAQVIGLLPLLHLLLFFKAELLSLELLPLVELEHYMVFGLEPLVLK